MKDMTQEELMVGDLVMFNKGVDKVQEIYGKVGNVYLQEYGTIEISRLSPIPLTAEILAKNGFVEFMPHNWQIVIDDIMIELREPERNMAIWLDWTERYRDVYASYIFPGPNCVHELQHILRLCNIDKEIEL